MCKYYLRAKLRNNEFDYKEVKKIIEEIPLYLECVESQTEELQWIAIKGTYWAYQYVKNPTKQMTDYCLGQNGHIIQFIDNPSDEQLRQAIKKNWMAIVHIKQPSLDLCKLAYRICRAAIDYMPDDMANIVKWVIK